MREVGQASKKSETIKKTIVTNYLTKARELSVKTKETVKALPSQNEQDLSIHLELEYYLSMLDKHIDLLDRRILKGETIPHHEKVFSIFETYTQWITKGKQNPSFELGKNMQITTDQFHFIVDFKLMDDQTDSQTVVELARRLLAKFNVNSWSFDKGFFSKENKEALNLLVDNLVMPKKGKLNKAEYEEEHKPLFKKLRNGHSAVESNINELEHKGLDRCPDRGYAHFKNYVALGVCAYNLHRIGAELQRQALCLEKQRKAA
jgi:hypothetical protein